MSATHATHNLAAVNKEESSSLTNVSHKCILKKGNIPSTLFIFEFEIE